MSLKHYEKTRSTRQHCVEFVLLIRHDGIDLLDRSSSIKNEQKSIAELESCTRTQSTAKRVKPKLRDDWYLFYGLSRSQDGTRVPLGSRRQPRVST